MDFVNQNRYPVSMTPNTAVRYLDRTTPPHISTLILLASLPALSMNMFLPSLPAMAEYFAVDYRLMQLSVALYLGVSAILQLMIGPLSDRFGRRPLILAGGALFLLATLGCIWAPTAEIFLAFRMAQAVIATGMAISRAVVRDMVPDAQAASMIGYVTMGMSLAPMLGPLLGGVLDSYFGWHSVFWLLFVLGVALFVLSWYDLGETSATTNRSFAEQFRQYPELLMSRRFWGYCLSATFASGAFFAYLGGAPFVGKEIFHMNAIWLGLSFGAVSFGYMMGNFLSGRFSTRIGINRMILFGCIIAAVGISISMALFYLGLGNAITFFAFMSTVGLGNGMTLPNASAGMLSVRPDLAGSASGLGGAILIGGGAGLSAFSGSRLSVDSGVYPLLWIMIACSVLAILAILFVMHRERQLSM
nr:multidrug effflux MFS transporter [Profundibacter amoris]